MSSLLHQEMDQENPSRAVVEGLSLTCAKLSKSAETQTRGKPTDPQIYLVFLFCDSSPDNTILTIYLTLDPAGMSLNSGQDDRRTVLCPEPTCSASSCQSF